MVAMEVRVAAADGIIFQVRPQEQELQVKVTMVVPAQVVPLTLAVQVAAPVVPEEHQHLLLAVQVV
jgi:hypothetical protein